MTKVTLRKVKKGRRVNLKSRRNRVVGKTVGIARLPGNRTIRIIKGKITGASKSTYQDRGFYDPQRKIIAIGKIASASTLRHEIGHAVDHLRHPRKVLRAYKNPNPSPRTFHAIERAADLAAKKLRIRGRI